MKIIASKQEKYFIPIEVTLTIQTQEELEALQTMTKCNTSIPACIKSPEKESIIYDFLNLLRNNITEY